MGTRIEQLERQVEVLRAYVERAAIGRDLHEAAVARSALAAANRIAAEPVEETDAAPTWRPIAELPPEWRDGREVTLSGYGEKHVAAFDGLYWVTGHGRKVGPVTHYLDLAIPEVPRG